MLDKAFNFTADNWYTKKGIVIASVVMFGLSFPGSKPFLEGIPFVIIKNHLWFTQALIAGVLTVLTIIFWFFSIKYSKADKGEN